MSAVPGLTDSAEYSELWLRASEQADPLASARRYQLAAADLVLRGVQDRRAAGVTWAKIGASLGTSLQAAAQLYGTAKRRR